ncbi:MAG: DNA topoisomerase I [Planctomycetes bacterium RIFCSPLOWO2_12_FULL_39_13]|nr:MAG: DNA topoisomerase I [Planctomycetes bacterium RIFCSPLOWO2_12_FULL_39_13]
MAKTKKSLVIVESPAKAKTIGKYLGSSFIVRSSMGHVRDLPEKKLSVDIENNFTPEYKIIPSRKKLVSELLADSKKVDTVYLASDLDREGEAIAWHLCQALEIPDEKAKRVTFNEITKDAILDAFNHPGPINMAKVNAQQARRILDRLVGYQISPLLWKKITKGLSAGRVQSVAVRLIVEREKEIKDFKSQEYWKITAELKTISKDKGKPDDIKTFKAILQKAGNENVEIKNEQQTKNIVFELQKAEYVVVGVKKQTKRNNAPPPFTTSLLQQQGSTRLQFSAKKTMLIAQQLYEGVDIGTEGSVGLITYMRTDSFHISEQALASCRNLISGKYGQNYLPEKPNVHASNKKGTQGAHEAVRPTNVEHTPESLKDFLTKDQLKLYELIWNRFVASQMKPALYAVTDVEIVTQYAIDATELPISQINIAPPKQYLFKARGRELLFDGHTVISGHEMEKDEQILPPIEKDQILKLIELVPTQHFTQPPPRFSEASLVKTLEKMGIGRPSTYANIISTIQDRGYVKHEKRAFYATELGTLVTEKLIEHFPKIMDAKFTSHMEDELDKIEDEKIDWLNVLKEFYEPFKTDLERATGEMKSVKGTTEESKQVCTICGQPMVVRWGKHGKFLGCSAFPKCKSTLPLDGKGEPVPPEATDQKCEKCGSAMVVKTGRHGKFLACSAYPNCKNTKPLSGEATKVEPTNEKCEKCGSLMVIRSSKKGRFMGCSAYPKCRNIKSLPTGIKCPKEDCGGDLIQRRSKRGGIFFGCSKYPDCDYITKELPDTADATKEESN